MNRTIEDAVEEFLSDPMKCPCWLKSHDAIMDHMKELRQAEPPGRDYRAGEQVDEEYWEWSSRYRHDAELATAFLKQQGYQFAGNSYVEGIELIGGE